MALSGTFGCDRQCDESARNWEESVDRAAERKAQRKHEKRMKQSEHANRWRDAMRGGRKEVADAPDETAEEMPAEVEMDREVDDARSESEQQLGVDTERETEPEARVDDPAPSVGGPPGRREPTMRVPPTVDDERRHDEHCD